MYIEHHFFLAGPNLYLLVRIYVYKLVPLPKFVVIYVFTHVLFLDADGLVKLWMVKTNECIATYDQHEDKVL